MSRQKEYEMQAADARRRWDALRAQERAKRPAYVHNSNTLGPQEDVVESRRRLTRNHVVVAAPRSVATKRLMAENILLLALLALSIYALYCLSIHVLNQS